MAAKAKVWMWVEVAVLCVCVPSTKNFDDGGVPGARANVARAAHQAQSRIAARQAWSSSSSSSSRVQELPLCSQNKLCCVSCVVRYHAKKCVVCVCVRDVVPSSVPPPRQAVGRRRRRWRRHVCRCTLKDQRARLARARALPESKKTPLAFPRIIISNTQKERDLGVGCGGWWHRI